MSKTIGVIGCGYVGFNLIKTFSKQYQVIGYDISVDRIGYLTESEKMNNVTYTINKDELKQCNVYLIAVPTNVTENKQINLNHLNKVKEMLNQFIKKGDIVVLESSIYVGGTRFLFQDYLEHGIYVGFSPERISPGDHENCHKIPKLISGLNKESLVHIKDLYDSAISNIIPVSSSETAEMCKLYENCFRVVNIAYVNEIADLCKSKNINVHEVIEASSTKPFGFMPFHPGFGIGGFCLPQNPYYLMNDIKNPKKDMPILTESINVLNERPKKRAQDLQYKNMLLIGIGFKADQTLTAMSPSLELYNNLLKENKKVTLYDPSLNINADLEFTVENLKQYDNIIIGCNNSYIDHKVLDLYKEFGNVTTF